MVDHIRADSPADEEPGSGLTCEACGIEAPHGEIVLKDGHWLCADVALCCARIRLLAQQEQERGELPPLTDTLPF